MRIRSFVPWVLVGSFAIGGGGIGTVLAQAINEPGWPPPEGAACKPSKKDTDEAKTLYSLGNNAYQTSNYTDAIKYWKDAYKRDCSAHLLLKNLGKAYEADGQYAAAVEVYKLYRTRGAPKGEELDLIDQKIGNLSKKIPATTATPTDTTTGTSTATTTTGTTTGTSTAPTTTASTTTTASPSSTTTTSTPSSGPGIAPWIVVGGGGAVTIVGGILWITGNSKVSAKNSDFQALHCDNSVLRLNKDIPVCNSIASDGNSAKTTRTIGIVLTGVGLAAVAGGLVWALTGGSSAPKETASLQITPGPGTAGIGLSGSF